MQLITEDSSMHNILSLLARETISYGKSKFSTMCSEISSMLHDTVIAVAINTVHAVSQAHHRRPSDLNLV